jgi:hypothetical protein
VALKKPSDIFKKEESSGIFVSSEVSPNVVEKYDKFLNTLDKVNYLSEKVENLSKELSEKLSKTDLDNAMLSHLMVLDENFKKIQAQVKGLNKEDLLQFKNSVSNLTNTVSNLVEEELPKYKKQVKKSEIVFSENIDELKTSVDEKLQEIADVLDHNLEYFNQYLIEEIGSLSSYVNEKANLYEELSNTVHNKIVKENKKFQEYSNLIEGIKKEISNIKADFFISEKNIEKVDRYLQEYHQEIVDLKEEVFLEINKLPVGNLQENIKRLEKKIDFIKETYSKIEPEIIVKEVIKEGLVNEPPSTNNSDPLTPLDQNFVTLDQLQQHYKLFINRIQQQLSTIGGGGETQLKYLDDIVGIATNASAYDGKFLKYDHSQGKFEFVTVSVGGDYASVAGIATYASTAGIATVSQGLDGIPNIQVGIVTSDISIPTQLRTKSVAEKTTLIDGNTVGLAFSTGGGNVAICTNPTGNITLNVTDIPTDSSFDNHSISFSVIVNQTGTARTCTAVTLNGVIETIRWSGGSLSNALSGVTTTTGYDIFTFTGINTVGSASTTSNYVVLGSVNGGFN